MTPPYAPGARPPHCRDVTQAPEPLWRALRAALDDRGYSIRGFAKVCAEADPRMTWDSWRRTIMRALEEDRQPPYNPSQETAELWARLLKKPARYFVGQPVRVALREELERLRDENRRLRAQLDRQQARS